MGEGVVNTDQDKVDEATAAKLAREGEHADAEAEVIVMNAALDAAATPFAQAKTAEEAQEKSTEDATAAQSTTKAELHKTDSDLTKLIAAHRQLKAEALDSTSTQGTLEAKEAETAEVVAKTNEAHSNSKAQVVSQNAVLALAEGTRNDADLDFEQKEDEATTAGDNYKSAKTEVTEAKAAAKASRGLATKEESDLKKKSSTVQRTVTPIQIEESSAFKDNTKEHKEFKTLERALSNADLKAELAKRQKSFNEGLSEKDATKVDSANADLTEATSKYTNAEQELARLGAGLEVYELGN